MTTHLTTGFCGDCTHYAPHEPYNFMGLCCRTGELRVYMCNPCPDYSPRTEAEAARALEERGWAYCATCREPLFTPEELKAHSGHLLVSDVFLDEAGFEDSPAAD